MESSLMVGQIVSDHVGSAQVREGGVQYGGGILLGEARSKSEIASTGGVGNLAQEGASCGSGLRLPHIYGIDQGAGILHRAESVAGGMQAEGVEAVGEEN